MLINRTVHNKLNWTRNDNNYECKLDNINSVNVYNNTIVTIYTDSKTMFILINGYKINLCKAEFDKLIELSKHLIEKFLIDDLVNESIKLLENIK